MKLSDRTKKIVLSIIVLCIISYFIMVLFSWYTYKPTINNVKIQTENISYTDKNNELYIKSCIKICDDYFLQLAGISKDNNSLLCLCKSYYSNVHKTNNTFALLKIEDNIITMIADNGTYISMNYNKVPSIQGTILILPKEECTFEQSQSQRDFCGQRLSNVESQYKEDNILYYLEYEENLKDYGKNFSLVIDIVAVNNITNAVNKTKLIMSLCEGEIIRPFNIYRVIEIDKTCNPIPVFEINATDILPGIFYMNFSLPDNKEYKTIRLTLEPFDASIGRDDFQEIVWIGKYFYINNMLYRGPRLYVIN